MYNQFGISHKRGFFEILLIFPAFTDCLCSTISSLFDIIIVMKKMGSHVPLFRWNLGFVRSEMRIFWLFFSGVLVGEKLVRRSLMWGFLVVDVSSSMESDFFIVQDTFYTAFKRRVEVISPVSSFRNTINDALFLKFINVPVNCTFIHPVFRCKLTVCYPWIF